MKVKVKFFASFRDKTGEAAVELEAETLEDLIDMLTKEYEGLQNTLLNHANSGLEIKSGVTVMLNGRNVRFLDGLDTELSNEDTVAIFPPVGGG
ncbi:MoaD family protein [Candidatus Bipolaricaulota bacterium]|nr:MoaD family protein [Candidatus Bipolaricaulota bacterium]